MADNTTRNADELGALWMKRTTKNDVYFTGSISLDGGATKTKIVVFKNGHKKADTHPDYRILLSRPKGETAPRQDDDPFANASQVTDDDIPF